MHSRTRSLLVLLLLGLPACDAIRVAPQAESGRITIEAAIFQGGYGIGWHRDMAARFNALDTGVTVDLWGDPRVVEKVKPRILRGNPPDLIVTRYLPVWVMIGAGFVGFLFRRSGFPLPPLLIGLILGLPFEQSLRQALLTSGGSLKIFAASTISVGFLALTLLCMAGTIAFQWRSKRSASNA